MVSSASHYDAFAGGAFADFTLVNDPREFSGNYFYGVSKFANGISISVVVLILIPSSVHAGVEFATQCEIAKRLH